MVSVVNRLLRNGPSSGAFEKERAIIRIHRSDVAANRLRNALLGTDQPVWCLVPWTPTLLTVGPDMPRRSEAKPR